MNIFYINHKVSKCYYQVLLNPLQYFYSNSCAVLNIIIYLQYLNQ